MRSEMQMTFDDLTNIRWSVHSVLTYVLLYLNRTHCYLAVFGSYKIQCLRLNAGGMSS